MERNRATQGVCAALLTAAVLLQAGCVTVADFRKLQRDVMDLKRGGGSSGAGGSAQRLADLSSRLDALEQENEMLLGRLEVAEHRAGEALREARAARQAGAVGAAGEAIDVGAAGTAVNAGVAGAAGAASSDDPDALANAAAAAGNPKASEELAAYKTARSAWSSGDWNGCVDRLGEFLQTYPSSVYADDAAYWRADCYFQQGNYKKAILRFDDVVARYPNGNKAADALYREGEALLKLGPAYHTAARKAFERVLSEYPDSERAAEASKQLSLL
ncbi:MAG TPA: tol-pal system protein YbgF [Myxococcota bacterium]|nr:tol-pal system protein YbgF [Myxococcota bacterium]